MGKPSTGGRNRVRSCGADRKNRRCAAAAASKGSKTSRGSSRARFDAHHRRSGRRPRACRPWRRCHAYFGPASALHRLARKGHRTRQALRFRRSVHARWRRRVAASHQRSRCFLASLSAGVASRPGLRSGGCCGASPGHRVRLTLGLMAISAHGLRGAASIHWCRRRPASMSRKRKPPASKGQRNCRVRRSIMPVAICLPSACSWRASANRVRAEAGWCAFRSRRPGAGSGL